MKQFVGFEHTITPPCEEPSLFRCVQFICQPPHVTAVPLQDYQFVYVTQANEVRHEEFRYINYKILALPFVFKSQVCDDLKPLLIFLGSREKQLLSIC